jgi:hypothetical protein
VGTGAGGSTGHRPAQGAHLFGAHLRSASVVLWAAERCLQLWRELGTLRTGACVDEGCRTSSSSLLRCTEH